MTAVPAVRVVVVGGAGLLAGLAATRSLAAAAGVSAMVLALALCLAAPVVPLLAVLPAAFGSWRLGPASIDMSLADVALVVGALVAIPFVPWRSPRVRLILGGLFAYEAILAVAVLAHPTMRAVLEWGHRILLVGGAVAVGAALAHLRQVGPAIRWYLVTSAVIAVAACVFSLANGFAPAYPFGIHKNSAGLLLASAFLITIVAPRLAAIPPSLANPLRLLLLAGVLASQSRGAMVAAIAGMAALQMRGRTARRAAPLAIAAVVAMGTVVALVSGEEFDRTRRDPNAARHTGLGSRQATNSGAMAIWSRDPVFGAGLRYFKDPARAVGEPHNIFVVTLAESGLVGMGALVVLLGAAWAALRKVATEEAAMARVIFAVRVLAAVFDIYWVAGRGSFSWVLVGLAVGVETKAARPAPVEAGVA